MSYGFTVYSQSGELLARQDLRLPHYIGRATYIGKTYWAETDRNRSPLVEYRISSPGGPPLPVIRPASTTHRFGVKSVTQLDATTWSIVIVSTNAMQSASDGSSLVNCEVHCFAQLGAIGAADAYGTRVFDASGRVAFDSTRGPMAGVGAFSLPYETSNVSTNTQAQTRPIAIGSPVVPGIFGAAHARHGLAFWEYTGAFMYDFNGTLTLYSLGAALEFGGPSNPVNSSAAWFIGEQTGLVIDLYPYV